MKKLNFKIICSIAILFALTSCDKKKKVVINDPVSVGIKSYSGQIEALYDNTKQADPAAFLDLDNGKVYKLSQIIDNAAIAKDIDLIWTTTSVNADYMLLSPHVYGEPAWGNDNWPESTLFAGWSVRNNTIIDKNTNQTVAQFNAVTNATELKALYDGYFEFSTLNFQSFTALSSQLNYIYFVETTNNGVKKKGYINFTSGQIGLGNFANFQIKIEQ